MKNCETDVINASHSSPQKDSQKIKSVVEDSTMLEGDVGSHSDTKSSDPETAEVCENPHYLEIYTNMKEHVPEWSSLTSVDQLEIRRLSGLSNACYKVTYKDSDDKNL